MVSAIKIFFHPSFEPPLFLPVCSLLFLFFSFSLSFPFVSPAVAVAPAPPPSPSFRTFCAGYFVFVLSLYPRPPHAPGGKMTRTNRCCNFVITTVCSSTLLTKNRYRERSLRASRARPAAEKFFGYNPSAWRTWSSRGPRLFRISKALPRMFLPIFLSVAIEYSYTIIVIKLLHLAQSRWFSKLFTILLFTVRRRYFFLPLVISYPSFLFHGKRFYNRNYYAIIKLRKSLNPILPFENQGPSSRPCQTYLFLFTLLFLLKIFAGIIRTWNARPTNRIFYDLRRIYIYI